MTSLAIHFVDPTIPGISGRSLVARAVEFVQTTRAEAETALHAARRDYAIRKGLARLDRHLLRDIGVDRDAL